MAGVPFLVTCSPFEARKENDELKKAREPRREYKY